MPHRELSPGSVVVYARGRVSSAGHSYAREKVAHAARLAPGPVVQTRVDLLAEPDPAREAPVVAKATVDSGRSVVRAHATAPTVREAVDGLADRLGRRFERARDRVRSEHLRHRGDGEWRHGDAPAERPSYFPRPVDEREIVRRKTFALDATTPEEAVADLEALDHDFYLFENAETGDENVVHRLGGGDYELLAPGATATNGVGSIGTSRRPVTRMSLDEAVEILDLADEPFVFFVDERTGRGHVVYRRYDGHYGLVMPADPHVRVP